ncbi:MAG: FtsX-like permease family protein [Gemmatimonas sp.]
MSVYGEARAWLRAVMLRRRAEREMHEEMTAHIEQAAARFVARGMSERDALHAARKEFGNVALIQERSRDSRGGRWVDNLRADVRYALRHFARTPLTTITILFAMLLGVGGNAALYSVMQPLLFRTPPGVPNDPSLVMIRGTEGPSGRIYRELSYPELLDFAAQSVFAAVAGFRAADVAVDLGSGAEDILSVRTNYVTPNFFNVLGAKLAAGPGFMETRYDAHELAELTVVVDYKFAVKQFGTPAAAIGKTARVNGVLVTIVGVAPKRLVTMPHGADRNFWIPVSALPAIEHTSANIFASDDSSAFRSIARLAEGQTVVSAMPVVRNLAARHFAARAPVQTGASKVQKADADVIRLRGNLEVGSDPSETLWGAAAVVALDLLILLVCTTTVSSLLVGAAVTRRHEIGIRLALGASRVRIVRQLLTETLVLALAGAIGGLLLFTVIRRLLEARMEVEVASPWSTVGFTAAVALFTALLSGLSPALHATRQGLAQVLKNSSAGATSRSRLQRVFVIAQIALAQPLLVSLVMFMIFVSGEFRTAQGKVDAERLLVVRFDAWSARGKTGGLERIPAIIRRLESTAGVRAVIPQSANSFPRTYIELASANVGGAASPSGTRVQVMPAEIPSGYFRAMDVEVLSGREFIVADSASPFTPIIVSSRFVHDVLEDGPAIGRRFYRRIGPWMDTLQIVGVVAAEHGRDNLEQMFMRLRTMRRPEALLIRTIVPAASVIPTVRNIVRNEAPMLPVVTLETVAQQNRNSRSDFFQISMASAAGGLTTLLLGCVGLYAVVALAVGQRKREIGIRVALGAQQSQVLELFFLNGLKLSLIGLFIGLPLSATSLHLLATQVGMPRSNMMFVTAIVALMVIGVASIATWLPARKAANVDPLVALRAE